MVRLIEPASLSGMANTAPGVALAALAREQDGIVTTADLRRLGITHRQIHRWALNGRLLRLRRGLFAVGHHPATRQSARRAALLATGERAALGYATALSQRGIVELRGHEHQIHVVVQRGGPRPPAGVTLHRHSVVDERDIDLVDGLRCTSVALTLVQLAGVLTPPRLAFACERVEYARQLDVQAIATVLARMPAPRGVRALRTVLADTSLETALLDSSLERRALALIQDAGLPVPEVQRWFDLRPDHVRVRPDLWYPAARLVVEVDGPHHELPIRRAKDIARDDAFARRAIDVMRIKESELDASPASVVSELRRRLADRWR